MTIPPTYQGVPVTSIEDGAFALCTELTSITIPSSVKSIGNEAFEGCTGLTSITIPDGVTSIGHYAFYGCGGLTSLTIPSSVTSIGGNAFGGCYRLTRVTIPDGVRSIGDEAFAYCSGLTSVTILDGVKSIGKAAFFLCRELTSIEIPSSVTSIGDGAFAYCSGLTSVTISDGVTSIGKDAFKECSALTSLKIPGSVTSIGEGAFAGCSELTSVPIPDGVTSIEDRAFAGWHRLSSIKIPSSVTSIGNYAFSGCKSLTSVTIPGSVTSIGKGAFHSCSGLTSITIPDGVTSIAEGAFAFCTGLTSVTIPSGVESIGDYAFYGCSGLTDVWMPGYTVIGKDAFPSGARIVGSGNPIITQGPAHAKLFFGQTATYRVSATGNAPLRYQWRKDGANIPGATSSTYTIASVRGSDAGNYSVVVSNPGGTVTSANASLEVGAKKPVVSVPANVFAEATSAAGATVMYDPATATDDVTASPTITYSKASGTMFPVGVTTVTVSASNAAGSVGTGTFTVTVSDTTKPVVSAPANVSTQAGSASGAEVVYAPATATDSVTASPTITYSKVSGTMFPIGVTTVTVSASDAAGNVGTGTFTVTVTAPVTRMPQTIRPLQPPPITYGDNPIELKTTSSSGLPVTISVKSGPAKMSVDGTKLEVTGAGNVVLSATQSGNANFLPAPAVNHTLVVRKKVLKVTIPATKRAVGHANPVFGLEYFGFVGNDTKAVLDRKPVASTGAKLSSPAGVYSVTASGGSDDSYAFEYEAGQITLVGFGGAYEALMQDEGGHVLGKLELTIPDSSMTYTGKLTLSGESAAVPMSGRLIPDGELTEAIGTVTRAPRGVAAALEISFTQTGDGLMASVKKNGANFLSSGTSGALLYKVPARTKAPWAGAYTMIIETDADQDGAGRSVPRGVGYATVTIEPTTGVMAFAGKLADGTTLTGSCKPDADGGYRVFQKPYGARLNSALAGEMRLRMHPDQDKFAGRYCILVQDGKFVWTKAALKSDPSYRAGFGPVECSVGLDPWIPASAAKAGSAAVTLAQRLGLATTNTLGGGFGIDYGDAIDLGNLQTSLPTKASLSATNTVGVTSPVTAPANVTRWTMSVSATTGAFSGRFTLSDVVAPATRATQRIVNFYGVLRQGVTGEEPIGGGFFLLPALPGAGSNEVQSGEIWLSAPTP